MAQSREAEEERQTTALKSFGVNGTDYTDELRLISSEYFYSR
jgi:hypothetical protein